MEIRLRRLLPLTVTLTLVLILITLPTRFSLAGVPDPARSSVSPGDALHGLVVSPGLPQPIPASIEEIVLRWSDGRPFQRADVIVDLGARNPGCPGATFHGVS